MSVVVVNNNDNPSPVPIIDNETNTIIDSLTEADRTLQKVATAPGQASDYIAKYLTYAAELMGVENFKRVKPGMLKIKNPDTFVGIYNKFETMVLYANDPQPWSEFTWVTLTMLVCSAYTPTLPIGETLYCYDNILADFLLNNGEPEGIYGYVDMFTWDGWWQVVGYSALNYLIVELLIETITAYFLAHVFSQMDASFPLCQPGEGELVLFGSIDLCEYFQF